MSGSGGDRPGRPDPIPVTVLGGYLGAGKTTILNEVLRTGGGADGALGRVAVLVNDFGSITVDEALITSADDDLLTLSNGCICCSLVDGFAAALDQVRAVAPDRLLIETSGVAHPDSVAAYAHTPGFVLDGVIVAADAETVRRRADDRYVGDTVRSQLAAADLVALTKVDLVSADARAEVVDWLSDVTAAPVVAASHGVIAPEALFGIVRSTSDCSSVAAPHRHDVDTQFISASWTGGVVSRAGLDQLLATVPEGVVRVKGVVRVDDAVEPVVVQVVGERQSLTSSPQPEGRGNSTLVAIALREPLVVDLDVWLNTLT